MGLELGGVGLELGGAGGFRVVRGGADVGRVEVIIMKINAGQDGLRVYASLMY